MSSTRSVDYREAPRVQAHPALIFVPALICSMLLHVLAVKFLPALPIGRTPEFKAERSFPDIALGDVRPEPPPSFVDEPARDPKPQAPANDSAIARASTEFQDALKPWLAEREGRQLSQLAAHAEPVAPARETAEIPVLDSRQEIMAVDRALFKPEEVLLPRAYTPDIPRVEQALDISLPIEQVDARLPELSLSGSDALPAVQTMGLPDGPLLASIPPAASSDASIGVGPSVLSQEPSSVIDQALDPLTPFIPAENLVNIQTQVFSPPDEPGTRYFTIHILPRSQDQIHAAPRRLMFIQDCSESMSIWKLRHCREGWLKVLNELRPDDEFNIMSFRDDVSTCFDSFTRVSAQSLAQARLYVAEMRPRGKTDVHASLEYLSKIQAKDHAATLAILVTDGRPTMGLVDSTDIIESFSRLNNGHISLFTVGSGKEANQYLLDLMGYRNRGGTLLVPDNNDLADAMENMNRQLYRPVLLNPEFRFIGAEGLEVYPPKLTHLYMDRPLVMTGKVDAGSPEIAFQLVGQSGQGDHDMVFRIVWEDEAVAQQDLRTAWDWQKMYALIGQVTRDKSKSSKQALRQHAENSGLHIPYAMEASDPIPR